MCMLYFLFSILLSSSVVASDDTISTTQTNESHADVVDATQDPAKNRQRRAALIKDILEKKKSPKHCKQGNTHPIPIPPRKIPDFCESSLKPSQNGSPLRTSPSVVNLPALDCEGVTMTQIITSRCVTSPKNSCHCDTVKKDDLPKHPLFRRVVGFDIGKKH